MISSMPTVILAGGRAKPEMHALTGQTNRALAQVHGKSLLRHVLDAVLTAGPDGGTLGPITVVGDLPDDPDYDRAPDQGDFVSNMFAGLSHYEDAAFVLISTADLPFVTGAVVGDFARRAAAVAQETGAGLVWPIVPVRLCYARFPGIGRTALRLREGEYTGGNLALVRPQFLFSHRPQIAAAYAARQSPVKLARILGLSTLGRLVCSQKLSPRLMGVDFIESRVSQLLGGPARALPCDHPEIATDLDRPSDFEAVAALGQQNAPEKRQENRSEGAP